MATKMVKSKEDFECLLLWLGWSQDEAEWNAARARSDVSRLMNATKGHPSTSYNRIALELAEAHEEAASVYRRRMQEEEKAYSQEE